MLLIEPLKAKIETFYSAYTSLSSDLIWNIAYSMVTSLFERQGTNRKNSAQIYENVSRTKEVTISSKIGISKTVDS